MKISKSRGGVMACLVVAAAFASSTTTAQLAVAGRGISGGGEQEAEIVPLTSEQAASRVLRLAEVDALIQS